MAHILVVDDDDIVAELASEILLAAGHACGFVSSAEDALKLLKWRRPDLLLLDEHLPGQRGTALLRTMRRSPELYDLPVIMVTAIDGVEDERRALFDGAQDYIRKPFHPKMLVWKVNQVLRSRTERPQHRKLEEWAEFQLHNHREDGPRQVYI